MTSSTSAVPRTARWRLALLWGGLVLLVTCVGLYTSGVSRAVAVWLLPLGAAVTIVGWVRSTGRRVPSWVYLALAVVAAALAVLGLTTLVYSLAHPPLIEV